MKTLIVTMSLPYPPASGGAIRVHGIVEGLHRAGHDVSVLCFHEKPAQIEHVSVETVVYPGRSTADRLRDLLFTSKPDIQGRFYVEDFAETLRSKVISEEYDIVQFEGIESVCYLPVVAQATPTTKLIFDTFNAEFELQRNIYKIDRQNPRRWPAALYSFLQVGRIKRFEAEMCRLSDAVIAVSQEDVETLQPFREDGRIHFVPNGIWVDRYTDQLTTVQEHTIVFTGKMDYRPNVDAMLWFTGSIFPLIKAKIPDAKLIIVGQQPHERLAHLREHPDVTITGWVDSVLPYLQSAAVYVAPLRMGSGTRLKLLEAMACGCAIVATTTASAGLHDEAKKAMIIKHDTSQFAEAVVSLLKSAEKRDELRATSRDTVYEYYDWSVLIPRLIDVYREIGVE